MYHPSKNRRRNADYTDIRKELVYIGTNLRYIRESKGWYLQGFVNYLSSWKVGISVGNYAKIERGEHNIQLSTLIRICKLWNVPLHWVTDKDMVQKYYLSSQKEVATDNLPIKKNPKLKDW
jgi:transcriptional regulator with XRE-family HTH domain